MIFRNTIRHKASNLCQALKLCLKTAICLLLGEMKKKTENGGNIWGHLRTNRAYNY